MYQILIFLCMLHMQRFIQPIGCIDKLHKPVRAEYMS